VARETTTYIHTPGERIPGPGKTKVAVLARSVKYVRKAKASEDSLFDGNVTRVGFKEPERPNIDIVMAKDVQWKAEKAELQQHIEPVIPKPKQCSEEHERGYWQNTMVKDARWKGENTALQEQIEELLEMNIRRRTDWRKRGAKRSTGGSVQVARKEALERCLCLCGCGD
jgi:hypothetical protein